MKEIGQEEMVHGRTDHRLSVGAGSRPTGKVVVPPTWLVGGELLPLANQVRQHERIGR